MNISTDKFYNLKINLLQGGDVITEKAAVRNIWEKDGAYYLELYLYRLQRSMVYEADFIQGIYDENSERTYNDINKFVADYKQAAQQAENPTSLGLQTRLDNSKTILQPIWDEIVLMIFMAHIDIDNKNLKEKVIYEYISTHAKGAEKLSFPYVIKNLSDIKAESSDFYTALAHLKDKKPDAIRDLFATLQKICLSDGRLHYSERFYLAELVQFFRLHNIDLI